MMAIEVGATIADFLSQAGAAGRSRLPVTGPGGLDDIVGVLDLDRAVGVAYQQRASTPVTAVMVAPVEVPESLPVEEVVRLLRGQPGPLAIVRDEFGGTAGLVTGEDLLEELVGEVDDEFDVPAPAAVRSSSGWEVSGLLRPDEVLALTGLRLPDYGPYDTVGGLIMYRLARVPVVGDRLSIQGVTATVVRMDGRRVDRALLSPGNVP
jgi:CBS domain containing-hemolysin-like protein